MGWWAHGPGPWGGPWGVPWIPVHVLYKSILNTEKTLRQEDKLHKLKYPQKFDFAKNYLPSDPNTETVISNRFAYPSRWRRKPW